MILENLRNMYIQMIRNHSEICSTNFFVRVKNRAQRI